MGRGVGLTVQTQQIEDAYRFGVYRIRIEAHDAVDMPEEVFMYLRRPVNAARAEEADYFDGVASPVDLGQYPVDEPNLEQSYQFFRKNYVVLDFASASVALAKLAEIEAAVQTLIDGVNATDHLVPCKEIRLGDPL